MTDTWNTLDEAKIAEWASHADSSVLVDSPDPLSRSAYDGSDLRFIDTVLADIIVFARLNGLSGLEDDLAAARARFVARGGRS